MSLLSDDFKGTATNAANWHMPTWRSPTDGTYVGRTQFRVTQSSPLPPVSESNVNVSVQSYNPTGFSFYGTDLISNQVFDLEQGVVVRVRARMESPVTPGVVGVIALVARKPGGSGLYDQITFGLLGTRSDKAQTNLYVDGAWYPEYVPLGAGSISAYHTYEIRWFPQRVSWYLDRWLVRDYTGQVPGGPVELHINMWTPDEDWADAFSGEIQPASTESANQVWSMKVDAVEVDKYVEGHRGTPKDPPGISKECGKAKRLLVKAKRKLRRVNSPAKRKAARKSVKTAKRRVRQAC